MGEELVEAINSFNVALKANKIDLEVLIGNEIYYTDEIIEELHNLNFHTLNYSQLSLVKNHRLSFEVPYQVQFFP